MPDALLNAVPREIRSLGGEDWVRFRELRLHALTTERGRFFRSPEEEAPLPEEAWRELLDSADRQIFGLFADDALVGITAWFRGVRTPRVRRDLRDVLHQAEYRGRGYSRLLFEARLGWVREQKRFARVITSHRASNDVSGRAIRAAGFVQTGRTSMTWPDGYELVL